jgi:hypothetical protein
LFLSKLFKRNYTSLRTLKFNPGYGAPKQHEPRNSTKTSACLPTEIIRLPIGTSETELPFFFIQPLLTLLRVQAECTFALIGEKNENFTQY